MAEKKKKPRERADKTKLEYGLKGKTVVETHITRRYFAKWVGIVLSFGFLYLIVKEIAGKNTDFRAIVGVMADLKANEYLLGALSLLLTGTSIAMYRAKTKAEKGNARNAQLEKLIDPLRTSSLDKDQQIGRMEAIDSIEEIEESPPAEGKP